MPGRPRISTETLRLVLTRSRRRCAVCLALAGDFSQKKGQIAHLDHDPSNNDDDNLVFLCFEHHDEYDSKTSQRKGLTAPEVKKYRADLWVAIDAAAATSFSFESGASSLRTEIESNKSAVTEHDIAIFRASDGILSEQRLLLFLETLQTDDSYRDSSSDAVQRFLGFFRETSNHYIHHDIAESTKALLGPVADLAQFVARNFFVHPQPTSVDEDWNYCLQPELCVDRSVHVDKEGAAEYARLQREIDKRCEAVRDAYKVYRRSIKRTLVI
jgi:hypothetical protein